MTFVILSPSLEGRRISAVRSFASPRFHRGKLRMTITRRPLTTFRSSARLILGAVLATQRKEKRVTDRMRWCVWQVDC